MHTAQIFLLEEWYEADKEENKKEEDQEGRMSEKF